MSTRATTDGDKIAFLDKFDQEPVSLLSLKMQQVLDVARRDGPSLPLGELHHKLRVAHLVNVGLADVSGLSARA